MILADTIDNAPDQADTRQVAGVPCPRGLPARGMGFCVHGKIAAEIAVMRLILIGVVSLVAYQAASAAESLPLGRHTVACHSYQDILDLKQTGPGEVLDASQPPFSGGLLLKYLTGTCQEYTAGTVVFTDKETTAQGLAFACIKAAIKDQCFWAIKE